MPVGVTGCEGRLLLIVERYLRLRLRLRLGSTTIDRLEAQFGVCDAVSRWFQVQVYQFVKLGQQSSDTSLCDAGVQQASVLGPILFIAHTSPVGCLISSHGVAYHKFADDIQLVIAFNTSDSSPAL